MISELEAFYLEKEEPTKSYLWTLREYILKAHPNMTESYTHKMPMFRLKGKLFCYLWVDKKTYFPYLGMYDGIHLHHTSLELGTRNKMKTITFHPEEDVPIAVLDEIFEEALAWRQSK